MEGHNERITLSQCTFGNVDVGGFGRCRASAGLATRVLRIECPGSLTVNRWLRNEWRIVHAELAPSGRRHGNGGLSVQLNVQLRGERQWCDTELRRRHNNPDLHPARRGGLGGQAWVANVTSFVSTNINLGSLTTWTANEGGNTANIDGEALVIAYKNPAITQTQTVAILQGFSNSGGDTSHVTFSALPAGFTAAMQIGDGFSYDGPDPNNPTNTAQTLTISVNGTPITTVAGHCDDDQDTSCANGSLITMGAVNAGPDSDPFTPFPCNGIGCIGSDHENYNLANVLAVGDTNATINTNNPSNNDNIFVETFEFSVAASVTTGPSVPEPSSMALLGAGLAGFGWYRRQRARRIAS